MSFLFTWLISLERNPLISAGMPVVLLPEEGKGEESFLNFLVFTQNHRNLRPTMKRISRGLYKKENLTRWKF
jgi:hypothetical protein